jgi:cell wall-associated NlpC family hydrolase
MVLKTAGIRIQRDTSLQIKTKDLKKIHIDEAEPGDLLFFLENNSTNHIAFLLGDGNIIHCSGQVKIESIIEGEPGFSKQLNQYEKIAMSIDGLILS